ncbi:MAG: SNF2-related protein [Bacillota bacterium]
MITTDMIKRYVPNRIYRRGVNYYREGRISDYQVKQKDSGSFEIRARVKGGKLYRVEINIELLDEDLYFQNYCNCPYDWGDVCKHEVAVLYKFIEEDYQQYNRELRVQKNYQKLLELSGVDRNQSPRLHYEIKGLINEDLKNFKLVLKSDFIADYDLEEIVERLNSDYFLPQDKSEFNQYFSGKELEVINRLSDLLKSKGRQTGSLLLDKNRDNFRFILDLIEDFSVTLLESGRLAERGQPLTPQLVMNGDHRQVTIELAEHDYEIYSDYYDQMFWTVIDGVVHQIDMSGFHELPAQIEIPEEKSGEFVFEVLPALREEYSLEVRGDLTEYELVTREPGVTMELDYVDEEIHCDLRVDFAGDSFRNSEILGLDLDNNIYIQDEEDPFLWHCRNTRAFARVVEFMEDNNFMVKPDKFVIKDQNHIQEFITDGLVHLPEEWEVTTTKAFESIEIRQVKLDPIIEVEEDSQSIDWFDFKILYNLGGETYTREQLESLISYNQQGEPYIQQGNSYYILDYGEEEDRVRQMLKVADKKEKEGYRSQYYNLLYYQDMIHESGITFTGNQVYDELKREVTEHQAVAEREIPNQVQGVLRDYQQRGYYWLHFIHDYHFGGILADDMGLGKTLQVLTLLRRLEPEQPAFVICPRSLIYNWQEEAAKFFPEMETLVYYGSPEERQQLRREFTDYELVVTSYSTLSRDFRELEEEDHYFSLAVLDEAQHIKNHRTKRARAAKSLKARTRLALTGTPLENSVAELWSIFDFLMPGYLGNYNSFSRQYINPIKKNDDQEKMEELKQRVAPFILRRRKEEVLQELPEKIVNIQPVNMTRLQEDSYQVVLDEVRGQLKQKIRQQGFDRSRMNVLSALTKLRQICNHPGLVLDEKAARHGSGKMETLREIVEEALDGGHKIIIFSQFVRMLKLIRQDFEKRGVVFEYLDGSTRKRMERVNNFNNNPGVRVFLISLKAGGLGLNLTAADMVVHVDPWWNPMVERQATDRAHRFGQQNRVMVYKLITRGTVEEKMLKLQRRKQQIFDNIIEDNKNPVSAITWQDIQELLEMEE